MLICILYRSDQRSHQRASIVNKNSSGLVSLHLITYKVDGIEFNCMPGIASQISIVLDLDVQ